MKALKKVLLFAICIAFASMSLSADELNPKQKKLRDDIMQYLAVEGYYAELDQDGRIEFYKNGNDYHIGIDSYNETPMIVYMYRTYKYDDEYDRDIYVMASSEICNSRIGVKIVFLEDFYKIQSEFLLYNAENFKYTFKKIIEEMDYAENDMTDVCAALSNESIGVSNKLPFLSLDIKIGNFSADNNVISDFGEPIEAKKAMYLKQRVALSLLSGAGTYNLGIRIYKDDKLVKNSYSKGGYSYELPIDLSEEKLQTIDFPGWGEKKGFWGAGNYRYEIWSDGYCIGSCVFEIK